MTHRNASTPSARWHLSNGTWYLARDDRRIAVIEPTWDDRSWFLFAIDNAGELVFAGAWRRIAVIKVFRITNYNQFYLLFAKIFF